MPRTTLAFPGSGLLLTKGEYQAEVSQAISTDGYQEDGYAAGEFQDYIRRFDGVCLGVLCLCILACFEESPWTRLGDAVPNDVGKLIAAVEQARHQHSIPHCQSCVEQLTRRARNLHQQRLQRPP